MGGPSRSISARASRGLQRWLAVLCMVVAFPCGVQAVADLAAPARATMSDGCCPNHGDDRPAPEEPVRPACACCVALLLPEAPWPAAVVTNVPRSTAAEPVDDGPREGHEAPPFRPPIG